MSSPGATTPSTRVVDGGSRAHLLAPITWAATSESDDLRLPHLARRRVLGRPHLGPAGHRGGPDRRLLRPGYEAAIMRLVDIQLAFPSSFWHWRSSASWPRVAECDPGPGRGGLDGLRARGARPGAVRSRAGVRGGRPGHRGLGPPDHPPARAPEHAGAGHHRGNVCVATCIITEASLTFFGLGVEATIPTWGSMLSDGRAYMGNRLVADDLPGPRHDAHVLALNVIGDWLREYIDPRMRNV